MNNLADICNIYTHSTSKIYIIEGYCANFSCNYYSRLIPTDIFICNLCHRIYCYSCISIDNICINCIYPDLSKEVCNMCHKFIRKYLCVLCHKIITICCYTCENYTCMHTYHFNNIICSSCDDCHNNCVKK